jgi:hypothetical protein
MKQTTTYTSKPQIFGWIYLEKKNKLLVGFWDGQAVGVVEITSKEDVDYILSLKNEGYTEEDVLNLQEIIDSAKVLFAKAVDCFFDLAEIDE